jgi:16S rRNA (guanine966-N2)-methyltransferase
LRPTPDRVRETLFNWLGQNLYGKRCLDLFAGSGALGFEAASREAEQVLLVENNRTVYQALQANTKQLALSNVALRCEDGLKFALHENGLFDVIFLDPPFKSDYLPRLLPMLARSLAEGGKIYLESGTPFEAGAEWNVIKNARAGAVHYQLLERK